MAVSTIALGAGTVGGQNVRATSAGGAVAQKNRFKQLRQRIERQRGRDKQRERHMNRVAQTSEAPE
jgi:hypothetical protein